MFFFTSSQRCSILWLCTLQPVSLLPLFGPCAGWFNMYSAISTFSVSKSNRILDGKPKESTASKKRFSDSFWFVVFWALEVNNASPITINTTMNHKTPSYQFVMAVNVPTENRNKHSMIPGKNTRSVVFSGRSNYQAFMEWTHLNQWNSY